MSTEIKKMKTIYKSREVIAIVNILACLFLIVSPAKDDILEGLHNVSEVENFIGAICKIVIIGPYF